MGRVAGVVKGAVGVFAAVFAVSKIKEWGKMATEAASVELAAQEKLTQVLKNNAAIRAIGPKEYLKSSNSLIAMAAQMQQKGVIGDEVLVGGMQQLGSMGFDDKIIKKIMPAIANLAVQQKGYNVTIEDTQALAKGLGRAIGGNVGFLSRMGVVLDKNQKKQLQSMSATKRAEYLYSLLTKRVGGLNEKFAQTGEGAKVQFLNNWSDRLEDIGKRIIPIKGRLFKLLNKMTPSAATGITKFFDNVDYAIRKLQPAFDKLGESFNYLSKQLIPDLISSGSPLKKMFEGVLVPALVVSIDIINKLFIAVDKTYNFIKDHWSGLAPIFAGVAASFLAIKTAQIAMSAWTVILTGLINLESIAFRGMYLWQGLCALSTWKLTAAQSAFNTALTVSISGLSLFVLAVGAVAAGATLGVQLYNKWLPFRKLINSLVWDLDKIKGLWGGGAGVDINKNNLRGSGTQNLEYNSIEGRYTPKRGHESEFSLRNGYYVPKSATPPLVDNKFTPKQSGNGGVLEIRHTIDNKTDFNFSSSYSLSGAHGLSLSPSQ